MHGVRRSRVTAAELQTELERSAVHADLIRRALIVRRSELPKTFGDEFRKHYRVVERALEANPDEYTLWAFRREVLMAGVNADAEASFDDRWQHELDLTTRALKWHPKAYPAWQHRLWLLRNQEVAVHVTSELRKIAIENEEKLSEFMLSRDCRNFHGWAHRMRIRTAVSSTSDANESTLDQKELEFVERMINEDFANYSAWHHRSVLLPKVSAAGPNSFLQDELAFVRQAFYTEPDVQSAWFYHRWLLSGAPSKGQKAVVVTQVLEDELKACNELLEIEPEARYALQTKAQLLVQLAKYDDAKELLNRLELLVSFDGAFHSHLEVINELCIDLLTYLHCVRILCGEDITAIFEGSATIKLTGKTVAPSKLLICFRSTEERVFQQLRYERLSVFRQKFAYSEFTFSTSTEPEPGKLFQ